MRILTANGDDLTDSSDPSRKIMRQIAGSFAEYEKARLVAKLRAARERRRAATGKCEGRKAWAEINPELVREAKRLRRRSPKGHQRSLREVAAELAKLGFLNERRSQFSAARENSQSRSLSIAAGDGFMLLVLIIVLIIVVVGALLFYLIDRFVRDGRLANLLKILVVLICVAAILQRLWPILGFGF